MVEVPFVPSLTGRAAFGPASRCATLLAVGLLTASLLAACGGRPGQPNPSPVPSSTGASGRDVRFSTSDGLQLRGKLFGTGPTAVVLAHMFPADGASWYPTAERLAEAGYTALAFNFRGYAPSAGSKDVAKAADDLLAAVEFLRGAGAERLTLVGASMGGTAALIAAARTSVQATVAISAPISFQGLDASEEASGIRVPVLLLASEDDGSAAGSLRKLAGMIPGATAKLYEGSAHGTNLFADRPEAVDVVLDFLREHAPPDGSSPRPAG